MLKLIGSDASGLELRCLAHYMAPYDGGEYGDIVANGNSAEGTDVHTVNQRAAGLPTRDNAKTFIYAFLYGAGEEKIGHVVGVRDGEIQDYKAARKREWNGLIKRRKEFDMPLDDFHVACCLKGRDLKKQFIEHTPALKALQDDVMEASGRGYLFGLDGRQLKIRSKHAALNTLLQSAGGIICKKWLVEVDKLVKDRRIESFKQRGWIHDECQGSVRQEEIHQMKQIFHDAMQITENYFQMKCPLAVGTSVGDNWKETH